ncbi:polycomb protein Asx-like [Dreissena polymorpha]|uniref:Polycomb protein Asx n=1 Tax=Dreissena polymorpha TaxID=45954 RepID=A0A9D3YEK7_DREPO|nr:polycomb protein Asx-like [Dreissena polymorpha]KAH3699087.1 hypothetical protein DPMN_074041 [Dreissena polymorpha]
MLNNDLNSRNDLNVTRSWVEAAKFVLSSHPYTPMSYKDILQEIQAKKIKNVSNSTQGASLNSCLHANAKGPNNTFYKVAGQIGVYGLMSELPVGSQIIEVEEDTAALLGDQNPPPVKQKVIYAKLLSHLAVSANNGVPGGGSVPMGETVSVPTALVPVISAEGKLDLPTRRSARQAQRKKRKHVFIPKITIKPIVPPKSDGTGPESYVTTTKVPESVSNNNHDSSSNSSSSCKETAALRLSGLTNGEANQKKTLREMLAGIPGFSMKPRKRTNKKLSHAAQIAQTMEGCIDLETPDSILVNTNLKGLLNKHTFGMLPESYQHKLINLLPECDRILGRDHALRLSTTALNNEFFAKACTEWRERLSAGEFTPENQQRLKQEEEREQIELDPWKAKHFEPVWGQKTISDVPKSDDVHKVSGDSSHMAARTGKVRKTTLVSTMLKQRSISQNVTKSVSSVGTLSAPRPDPHSGLLLKVEPRLGQPKTVADMLPAALKRPVISVGMENRDSVSSPPKRQKVEVVTKPVQSQANANTLAQIRAQSQAGWMQKGQSGLIPNTVYEEKVKPLLIDVSACTSSLEMKSPTRTLAQIKSQTQAAKAKVQGQTRTLAQIKAETKAHQQQAEAQAKLFAHLLAKAKGEVTIPQVVKQQAQSIVIPSPSRTKTTKTAEVEKNADGVNLKRSLEICEQAKILSQKNQESGGVSLLHKPLITSLKASSDLNFGNYLKPNIAQAHKTVSQILQSQTVKVGSVQMSHAPIPKPSVNAGVKVFTAATFATSTNVPSAASVSSAAVNSSGVSFVVLPPPSVSQVTGISPAVFNVPSTRYISSTAVAQQNLLQQLIRSAAGTISVGQTPVNPQRAASAPPQQKTVQRVSTPVHTIVRSASVGTNDNTLEEMGEKTKIKLTNKGPNSSGDIIVQIPSDKVNFLNKKGAAIIPGTNGSKSNSHHIILTSGSNTLLSAPGGGVGSAQTVTYQNKKENLVVHKSMPSEKVIIISPEKLSDRGNSAPVKVAVKDQSTDCSCDLKAMKACSKCGAFCHADCIGPSKLCVSCVEIT